MKAIILRFDPHRPRAVRQTPPTRATQYGAVPPFPPAASLKDLTAQLRRLQACYPHGAYVVQLLMARMLLRHGGTR